MGAEEGHLSKRNPESSRRNGEDDETNQKIHAKPKLVLQRETTGQKAKVLPQESSGATAIEEQESGFENEVSFVRNATKSWRSSISIINEAGACFLHKNCPRSEFAIAYLVKHAGHIECNLNLVAITPIHDGSSLSACRNGESGGDANW